MLQIRFVPISHKIRAVGVGPCLIKYTAKPRQVFEAKHSGCRSFQWVCFLSAVLIYSCFIGFCLCCCHSLGTRQSRTAASLSFCHPAHFWCTVGQCRQRQQVKLLLELLSVGVTWAEVLFGNCLWRLCKLTYAHRLLSACVVCIAMCVCMSLCVCVWHACGVFEYNALGV